MFHYIMSVRRTPNPDTSDYQGLGTPDPPPTGHSLFKLGTETYHDARTAGVRLEKYFPSVIFDLSGQE